MPILIIVFEYICAFFAKTEKATCYAFNYLFNLQLKACRIMFFAFTDAGNASEAELKSFLYIYAVTSSDMNKYSPVTSRECARCVHQSARVQILDF